jgi:hypothetical protein
MTLAILRRSSERISEKEEAVNGTDVTVEADDAAIPDISDRVDSKDHRPTPIKDASITLNPGKWRRDVPRWAAAVDPRSTTAATRADDLDV